MRNVLWVVALALVVGGCANKSTTKKSPIVHPLRAPRSLDKLEKAPLYTFNEPEVDIYLKHLNETEKDPIRRVIHLARKNIGQPYAIYLLGEGPYEIYDPDPMYCLDKSDCVTFVEQMYAMGLSKNWNEFFVLLQRLRYKEGKVGMVTRNHESVADWEPNNAWMFEDVTENVGVKTTPLHMTWRPRKFFAQFGIGEDMKDVTMNSSYIPRDNVEAAQANLREGDLIHIVRGNAKEQSVTHFGIVTFGPNGEVNMLNSREPKVVEDLLMGYLQRNKKVLGVKVLRPRGQIEQIVASNVR